MHENVNVWDRSIAKTRHATCPHRVDMVQAELRCKKEETLSRASFQKASCEMRDQYPDALIGCRRYTYKMAEETGGEPTVWIFLVQTKARRR